MPTLRSLAKVIRSKNAGPFTLTLDVMFERREDYERVKSARVLTTARISQVYRLSESDVRIVEHDPSWSIKATIPRAIPSGDPTDSDVLGAQQHAPLMDLEVP